MGAVAVGPGAVERARAWIRSARLSAGCWGYRIGGAPHGEPSLLVTAALGEPAAALPCASMDPRELRLAPLLLRRCPTTEATRRRVEQHLLDSRSRTAWGDYGFDASIPGWSWVEGSAGWVEPTAQAVLSLRAAGLGEHPRVQQGLRFLRDRQGSDGGWNFGNPRMLGAELESYPSATAWALLALQGLEEDRGRCEEALDWLSQGDALPSSMSLSTLILARQAHGRPREAAPERLAARQAPDGSFFQRVDVTALAVLALSGSRALQV